MQSKAFRNLITQTIRAQATATPRCPHAGECGGCAFQDRDYLGQVAAKGAVLSQIWDDATLPEAIRPPQLPIPVIASPDPYAYRTRMDYVATKGRFGLRMRGRFNYIVDLTQCHLLPPNGLASVLALWHHARTLGLPDYNIRDHTGFLRYLVVRRSPDDHLLLAAVTAAKPEHTEAMEALAALALAQPGVISFHWLINDSLTDLSFGTPLQAWGEPTLPMRVGDHTLLIGPNTFFQNNVYLLLPLLDAIKAEVDGGMIADLYGGVGTIALHIANQAAQIVTVESVEESSQFARENSARNGYRNIEAVCADVAAFLRTQPIAHFATIIADPPRIGLGPDVCAELLRLHPQRIIYVSCNPITQQADLLQLASGYRLTSLVGYDMFPHTLHMEAVAVLDWAGAEDTA